MQIPLSGAAPISDGSALPCVAIPAKWLPITSGIAGRVHVRQESCRQLWERIPPEYRQRLARFVRKTLSFSKCETMHEICLLLFLHRYNGERLT